MEKFESAGMTRLLLLPSCRRTAAAFLLLRTATSAGCRTRASVSLLPSPSLLSLSMPQVRGAQSGRPTRRWQHYAIAWLEWLGPALAARRAAGGGAGAAALSTQ